MSALQASAKEGIYEVKWLESCWSALGNLFGQKAMSTEALQKRFLSLVGGTSWKCECGGCCWRNRVRRSWRTRKEINIIRLKVGLRTDCYALPFDPGSIINMRWPAASSGASIAGVGEDRLEPAVSDVKCNLSVLGGQTDRASARALQEAVGVLQLAAGTVLHERSA